MIMIVLLDACMYVLLILFVIFVGVVFIVHIILQNMFDIFIGGPANRGRHRMEQHSGSNAFHITCQTCERRERESLGLWRLLVDVVADDDNDDHSFTFFFPDSTQCVDHACVVLSHVRPNLQPRLGDIQRIRQCSSQTTT